MTSEARRKQCAEAQQRYRARHADRVRAYKRSAPAEKAYQARAHEVRRADELARRELLPAWVSEAIVVLRALRLAESNSRSTKAWREAHPERTSQLAKKHSAIRRGAEVAGDVTVSSWNAILDVFGHACAYCLSDNEKLTVDHVQPISRGGRHATDNVVPACGSCNSAKKDRGILSMVNRVSYI